MSTIPFPPRPFVPDSAAPSSPPETSLPFPPPPRVSGLLGPNADGYRLWRCWARVRGKSGWAQMPVAGDDSQQSVAARMVKVSAAWTKVWVFYEAVRLGAPPQLPDPRMLDPNLTLEAWHDDPQAAIGPDGVNVLYRVKGRRRYACTLPVFGWVEGLLVPVPPLSNIAKGAVDIPPSAYTTNIV